MSENPLRDAMDKQNLTIAALSERSGVSDSTIKRALAGISISSSSIELLSDTLQTDLSALKKTSAREAGSVDTAIDAMREAYKARIGDLQQTITYLQREKQFMRLVIILLIAFICGLFALDIANPAVGWFRY